MPSAARPILLVEDNLKDVEMTLAAFERSGLANPIVVARDGVEADPAMRHMPVIMLTSSRKEQYIIRSYGLGVNAFVVKPVGYRDFFDAVRDRGLFWAVLNEPMPRCDSGAA